MLRSHVVSLFSGVSTPFLSRVLAHSLDDSDFVYAQYCCSLGGNYPHLCLGAAVLFIRQPLMRLWSMRLAAIWWV